MNVVIIGKNSRQFAQYGNDAFDDMQIVAYPNAAEFLNALSVRSLELHRMLLTQDGIDADVVSDSQLDSFIDVIERTYPSMKIVTFSKDMDMCKYLSQVMPNSYNSVHFYVGNIKTSIKLITDSLSMSVDKLKKKYANIVYSQKMQEEEEPSVIDAIPTVQNDFNANENVPGYVPPAQPSGDNRGFFKKVFGLKPKQKTQLVNENAGRQIGQGQGVDEFSENSQFYPNANPYDEQNNQDEDDSEFTIFDNEGVDLGLGIVSKPEPEPEPIPTPIPIPQENIFAQQDNPIPTPMPHANLEKTDKKRDRKKNKQQMPFDFVAPEVQHQDYQGENIDDINIPTIDTNAMKRNAEQFNFDVNQNAFNNGPNISGLDLDSIGSDEVGLFSDNLQSMMQSYEESNQKIVEKQVVVEKIVHVGGPSTFRNKNGVRILILTGDRRVGTTKLALNLANIFSKNEKVLFVDFDRYRHGSLGYLNVDEILEEPDHIQNGLSHLKSLTALPQVVHLNRKYNFYSITSMYGEDVTDEEVLTAQNVLARQKAFSTIIVDCPLDTLGYLTDLIRCSTTLLCVEDDYVGLLNLISMLQLGVDEKDLAIIFEKANFVVGRKGNIDKFNRAMGKVSDMFDLENADLDWSKLQIVGSIKDVNSLANVFNE